jgi:hypothetical protein
MRASSSWLRACLNSGKAPARTPLQVGTVPFLVPGHVDPEVDETVTLKLGQRQKHHFSGVFGDLADDFGHYPPSAAFFPEARLGLTSPICTTLSTPFSYATL